MPPTRRQKSSIRLSVAHDVRHLADVAGGARTWWCAGKQVNAQDVIVVYKVQHGIRWVLRVTSIPKETKTWCSEFGMQKVNVKVERTAPRPITSRELRANPVLGHSGAVRRNFQGKLFILSEVELAEIDKLLQALQDSS